MFLTEKEILDTPVALDLTCKYFEENAEKIEAFFAANPQRKFTIMGCGSSYMLSKSAAALLASYPDDRKCDPGRRLHCRSRVLAGNRPRQHRPDAFPFRPNL